MTKLFNQKFLLLVFCALVLAACGDDDDKVKSKGQFTLADETTKISSGVFVYDSSPNEDSEGDEYYRNELILVGTGLSIESSDGLFAYVGEGNMLSLEINNAGQELQAGTYTWQSEENEKPFDLWDGWLTLGVNSDDEEEYRLYSGEVVVTKKGSTYKVTFEGTAYPYNEFAKGIPPVAVTATFEGKLKRVSFDF